ncbi:MAG: phage antirepressor KilAC domain-containing protein [Firmicutes bacterium]|nr:phage antirepressor KilAC domain-containing protein [Bacillota bacterium]
MNELIKVNYDNERPTVSGRELHKVLEVKTAYKDWFPRMCEYGFCEGKDFNPLNFEQVQIEGKRDVKRMLTDHQMTIPMAKEICMIQRSSIGRKFRAYFIDIEEKWNSPEMVMKRALEIANAAVEKLKNENAVQCQQIAELKPKASYYDVVLNCKDLLAISAIAKDYGWSATKMNIYLHEKGVQYKQGNMWLSYQNYAEYGYTCTKTHTYPGNDGTTHSKVHTYWTQKGRLFIYGLMKEDGYLPLMEG